MQSTKSTSTPLPISLRLSQRDYSTYAPEGEIMKLVPYASAGGSLMFTMEVEPLGVDDHLEPEAEWIAESQLTLEQYCGNGNFRNILAPLAYM